jgi:hypothetical protein
MEVLGGVTLLTEQNGATSHGHWHDLCERAMKLLLPMMLTVPTLIQGGIAMRSRRGPADLRGRQLKVGIIFNVCYLLVVCAVSVVLALD